MFPWDTAVGRNRVDCSLTIVRRSFATPKHICDIWSNTIRKKEELKTAVEGVLCESRNDMRPSSAQGTWRRFKPSWTPEGCS